jgi:hypothetical protein
VRCRGRVSRSGTRSAMDRGNRNLTGCRANQIGCRVARSAAGLSPRSAS